MSEKLYYIQDARSSVGNCISWWCPKGHGYTCELNEAGVFTMEEALRYTSRDCDVLRSKDEMDAVAIRHVRGDRTHDLFTMKMSDVTDHLRRVEEQRLEEGLEAAFWQFDNLHKKRNAMSERDAFKCALRGFVKTYKEDSHSTEKP